MSDNVIGYEVDIILNGFNGNQPIKAKVDTGADISSLHANNVKLKNKVVEFDFGDRHITMPIVGTQSVRTADGGSENRPLVKFNVEIESNSDIKNKTIQGVVFNLNDRTNMPDKILLGKNFIEKGDFVVSGTANEPKVVETIEDQEKEEAVMDDATDNMDIMKKDLADIKETVNKIFKLLESKHD